VPPVTALEIDFELMDKLSEPSGKSAAFAGGVAPSKRADTRKSIRNIGRPLSCCKEKAAPVSEAAFSSLILVMN
jgi:hypothetical protein